MFGIFAKNFCVYQKSCNFASLELAKPLNNAQIGGSFFIYMVPYTKPAKSPKDLVNQLKQRGLIIKDEARAERYIQNIGYYRLSAYMFPFLKDPKTAHQYKPGVTFDQVLRLYRFDKKLRVVLFNEIEKIEVAFRAAMVNTMTNRTGDIFWMTNPSYVKPATLSLIQREYARSSEDFITHFKSSYSDPYPPAWMISEILPFGNITWIFKELSDSNKKAIAKQFYLQAPIFESWITIIALTRNDCCHHARVWNKVHFIISCDMSKMTRPWISLSTDLRRTYYNICIIKYFLDIISPNNDFKEKLIALFKQFPEIDLKAMGFNENWKDEPLWKSEKECCFKSLFSKLKK